MIPNGLIGFLKRHPALYEFTRHQVYSRLRSARRRAIFRDAYATNLWDGENSRSGVGSSLEATEPMRLVLPETLSRLGIRSILDVPCGDFHWMERVPLRAIDYVGADIVPDIIAANRARYGSAGQFLCLDVVRDPLPRMDAIFCRDCLVHLSLREARKALDNMLAARPRFILTTTFPDCRENVDTVIPYWRPLNLTLAPFSLPRPIEYLPDHIPGRKNDQGKMMGVWRLADL